MQAGRPNESSRWKRPRIYTTVLLGYFICMIGITISFLAYWDNHSNDIRVTMIFAVSLFLIVLSTIAIHAILKNKKNRFGISLISLILWTLSLWTVAPPYFVLTYESHQADFWLNPLNWGVGLFILTCTMYLFVLLDRKQIKIKSDNTSST
jgi:hypothetical protein